MRQDAKTISLVHIRYVSECSDEVDHQEDGPREVISILEGFNDDLTVRSTSRQHITQKNSLTSNKNRSKSQNIILEQLSRVESETSSLSVSETKSNAVVSDTSTARDASMVINHSLLDQEDFLVTVKRRYPQKDPLCASSPQIDE